MRLKLGTFDEPLHFASGAEALRGSFGFYRAADAMLSQNEQRKTRRLNMPVLAIGGAASSGENVAKSIRLIADNVESLVIPCTGHFVAEEAPAEMLAALRTFLATYRERATAAQSRN
jgi:pimeloyl-ACP methyl ester carboxylesterase